MPEPRRAGRAAGAAAPAVQLPATARADRAAAAPPARRARAASNLKPSGRVAAASRAEARPRAGSMQVAIDEPGVLLPRRERLLRRQAGAEERFHRRRRARQVLAMIGPSGCGKSTFLRCLNRMNDTIPGARVTGSITARRAGHPRRAAATWCSCAPASAWCSRSRTRFRSRSTTTSPTGRASTGSARSRAHLDDIVCTSLTRAGSVG